MNTSDQLTYQAKLSWRVTPKIKFIYNRMFSDTRSQSYSHDYLWNPDGGEGEAGGGPAGGVEY